MNGLRYLLTLAAEKLIRANWKAYGDILAPKVIFSFDFVSGQINAFGQYEQRILDALRENFFQDKESAIALDVGANIGNHSIYFARFFKEVHAFEPNLEAYRLLKINVEGISNVVCYQIGLSDETARRALLVNPRNLGAARIRDADSGRLAPHELSVTVEISRLDDMIDIFRETRIAFVKIDVEGHEVKAIAGMRQMLANHRPIVAMEQHENQIANGTSKAIQALRAIGYETLYVIEDAPSKFGFENIKPRFLRMLLQACTLALLGPRKTAMVRRAGALTNRRHSLVVME